MKECLLPVINILQIQVLRNQELGHFHHTHYSVLSLSITNIKRRCNKS